MSVPCHIAIISNEPTPYRLHVLRRIAGELSNVVTHNIFTHAITSESQPWQVELEPALHATYFAEASLRRGYNGPRRCAAAFAAIRDFLIKQNVKLIVLNGYNDLARLKLIRWAKQQNIPLLVAGDSNVFGEGRRGVLRRFAKRRVIRRVLREAAGLMPMGTCGRAFFRSFADHDLPTFLFPYEPAPPEVVQSKTTSNEDPHGMKRRTLLVCGRLAKVKRPTDALDAFAQIAEARPQWDLHFVGDGPLRDMLQRRVPDALRERVKFAGFVQGDALATYYRAADVLVHPAEFEPWGVVIHEAVAANLAVVTTEVVGSAVELVRHRVNGMIVPPRHVDMLADALRYVTQDDVCHAMQAAAGDVLDQWRKAADPVDGLRQALVYFNVI